MASSISTGEKSVPEEETVLQRHVAFFDRNKDGVVYPSETYQGFRALGCGIFFSAFASAVINIGLSSKTRPGKGFSFLFPIEVKNSHLAKHTSDSGVYDHNGRFVASKFEEIFEKHAHTDTDALTIEELKQFLNANKAPNDRKGGLVAYSEWKLLYNLGKDKDGLLHKETVRAFFDGSLFENLEKQRSSKAPMKHP